ncbi:MAG TPA: protein kinase [Kofleriaceae bacterium]
MRDDGSGLDATVNATGDSEAKTDDANAPTATPGTDATIKDGGAKAHVALAIGQRFGDRYEIRGYLGEGGMGAVYRAYDEVLGQEVALKVVRGAYADQATLRDEVRVAQKVTHPNVCRIYDLVDIDGRHFLKMEYIAGETLAERIASKGAMPIAEVIRSGRAIADGLAAAHAQGIVHRDLKPGNVMLAGNRVVLMDFGLARAVSDGIGDRSGTPSYMPPEQLAGAELDARSDLFALGCIVFELLAGKRAYLVGGGGSYTELATSRTEQPRPEIRNERRDTPRWLARTVNELLARDPAERSRGLSRLVRGPQRAWIAAIALAVVALAAVVIWWQLRPAPVWTPKLREVLSHVGNADGPRLSADGATVLFSADPGNQDKWGIYTMPLAGGAQRQVTTPDDKCLYARYLKNGRSIGMRCGRATEGRLIEQPIGGTATELGPGKFVEQCGDALVIARKLGLGDSLVLREASGRERVLVKTHYISSLRCSRTGSKIVYTAGAMGFVGGALRMVDREGHDTELVAEGVLGATFTPGERSVVFNHQDREATRIVEVDLATRARHVLTPDERFGYSPEVSADGKVVLYHRDQTSLPLYVMGTTGEREPKTFQREQFVGLAPVRGAELVIATRIDREPKTVVAINVGTGASREIAQGDAGFASDDGARVLWWRTSEPTVLWSTPIDGGAATLIARLPAPIVTGSAGPDGLHMLLKSGRSDAETAESWLVPPSGEPVREGSHGTVYVAPTGGWRMVASYGAKTTVLAFYKPGQPLTGAPAFERASVGRPAWVDATHASYCDPASCGVLDVESLAEGNRRPNTESKGEHLAAAPDGKRWFFAPAIAHVTLIEITNFADRPWKR